MFYYFISSNQAIERRNNVKKVCHKLGIEPVFMDAVMGKTLSEHQKNAVTIPNHGLTDSEIGCALSHLKIYENLIKSDFEAVLVFEDDIILDKEFSLDKIKELYNFIAEKSQPSVLKLGKSQCHIKKVKKCLMLMCITHIILVGHMDI